MIGFAILIVFIVAAVLMFLRKLPAILALPTMALAIALVEWAAGKLTLNEIGYAIFADGSMRLESAHRVSYMTFVGPIPENMRVARTCGNRLCVKPDHLSLEAIS